MEQQNRPLRKLPVPADGKDKVTHAGKWLTFKQHLFTLPNCPDNTQKSWEFVERTNHNSSHDSLVDSVEIVAIVKQDDLPDQIVLVVQYRPPIGKYCIEFPAGLIELSPNNDITDEYIKTAIMETARRELLEETGYVIDEVVNISPSLYNDPGLSNTNTKLVVATIDGNDPDNISPQPRREQDEWSLFTVLLPVDNLVSGLVEMQRAYGEDRLAIDAKLYCFAHSSYLHPPQSPNRIARRLSQLKPEQ